MANGQQNEDGILTPSPLYISALKYYKNEFHAKLLDILHDIAGTLTVNAPTFADFEHPDLHDGLDAMLGARRPCRPSSGCGCSTTSATPRPTPTAVGRSPPASWRAAASTRSGSSPCATSTCTTPRAWPAAPGPRRRRPRRGARHHLRLAACAAPLAIGR